MKKTTQQQIKEKALKYNNQEFLNYDIIAVPSKYDKKQDIEISAVVTAWTCIGTDLVKNREKASYINGLFKGSSPSEYVKTGVWENDPNLYLDNVVKIAGVQTNQDLKNLFSKLADVYLCFPDLESFVLCQMQHGYDLISAFYSAFEGVKGFADPAKRSPCRRMWLLLRWLVRSDHKADLGIWEKISPKDLLLPVDPKTHAIAQELGIISRKTLDRKAAEIITEYMAQIFPEDPALGDFAFWGMIHDPEGTLAEDWGKVQPEEKIQETKEPEPEKIQEEQPGEKAPDLTTAIQRIAIATGVPFSEVDQALDFDRLRENKELREIWEENAAVMKKVVREEFKLGLNADTEKELEEIASYYNVRLGRKGAINALMGWANAQKKRKKKLARKEKEESFNQAEKSWEKALERNQALIIATTYNLLFVNHIAMETLRKAVEEAKKAGLLKMQTKKIASDLLRAITNFERRAYSVYGDRSEFFKDCITRLMNEVAFDVDKVYYSIHLYLGKMGVENATPLARLEAACSICALAVDVHKTKVGYLRSLEPTLPTLDYMRLDQVEKFAFQLSDALVKGIGKVVDLNEDTNCVLSIRALDQKLANEDRIARAILMCEEVNK